MPLTQRAPLLALVTWLCLRLVLAAEVTEDRFIGWKGEVLDREPAVALNNQFNEATFDKNTDPWVETISWSPRAQIFHNFLTDKECEYVIKAAAPQMKRSTVVGSKGESVEDPIRTSYGTFLRRLQDETMIDIQKRVATWTHLPMVNQEDMQVLRYGLGQKYGAHYDSHEDNSPGPKHRVATVLLYLNDCPEGGETAFPSNSEWADPSLPKKYGPFSDCAEGHVAWKPKKGSALMFFTLGPDGKQDPAAMHTGCPVVRGYKWTATIWIHTTPFRPEGFVRPSPSEAFIDPAYCTDHNSLCETWAAAGECQKNPGYMVAGGACRKACADCKPCGEGDIACLNDNRRTGGYLILTQDEVDALGVDMYAMHAMPKH